MIYGNTPQVALSPGGGFEKNIFLTWLQTIVQLQWRRTLVL